MTTIRSGPPTNHTDDSCGRKDNEPILPLRAQSTVTYTEPSDDAARPTWETWNVDGVHLDVKWNQ